MGFFDSDANTAALSNETGFQDISGAAQSINLGAGKNVKHLSLAVESQPALNIAGEAVRESMNLARLVSEDSISSLSRASQSFASGLRSFGESAIADPGDQIAGLVKIGILVAGAAVIVMAWKGSK